MSGILKIVNNKKRCCPANLLRYVLVIIFWAISFPAIAQYEKEFETWGDEAMEMGMYQTAFKNYSIAFRYEKKTYLAYKCAEAARNYTNYAEALNWYSQVLELRPAKAYSEALFYQGMMLKQTGKPEEAIQSFQKYSDEVGENGKFSQRALHEIASCQWALQHANPNVNIEIQHLNNRVNTKNSETSAVQLGDSLLLFTSIRAFSTTTSEQSSLMPDLILSNIYESKVRKGSNFSIAVLNEWKLNKKNRHIPNFCFDSKHKRMYLTYCSGEYMNANNCEIFVSEIKNGEWTKPKKLPQEVNKKGYSATQPTISSDSNQTILYFVSNRPEGMGGTDIWYSVLKNEKFSPAVNLGPPVNTPGNEITPFYQQDLGRLYFSSDYHFGYGGYDVFYANGCRNQWSEVKNMGMPINTLANDFYFNVNMSDSLSGFLSSNRKGSYFIDNATCCNDIYRWQIHTPKAPADTTIEKVDSLLVNFQLKSQIDPLLPLSLYFHNDEPEPRTEKTITGQTYFQTLQQYRKLKPDYLTIAAKNSHSTDSLLKTKEVEWFFTTKVDSSDILLKEFMNFLVKDLEAGNRIRLTVKGYASPLYINSYNEKLSKRRISSLINELLAFKNGAIAQYLNNEEHTGASLEIIELAFGSNAADSNISRSAADINSVYGIAAALERRVDILRYTYVNDTANWADVSALKFENDIFSMGIIPANRPAKIEIPLYNSSNKIQEIEFVDVGCNCITARYTSKMQPHENTILELELSTAKIPSDNIVVVPLSIKLKSERITQTVFIQYALEK